MKPIWKKAAGGGLRSCGAYHITGNYGGDRWYTAGCVSVPENVMLTLLKKTKNGAYMVIVPEREMLRNY